MPRKDEPRDGRAGVRDLTAPPDAAAEPVAAFSRRARNLLGRIPVTKLVEDFPGCAAGEALGR
jgi:hypothetical protein